jgi:hypothetical protein
MEFEKNINGIEGLVIITPRVLKMKRFLQRNILMKKSLRKMELIYIGYR